MNHRRIASLLRELADAFEPACIPAASPSGDDRRVAELFLGRYGEDCRRWERDDLAALIAGIRKQSEVKAECHGDCCSGFGRSVCECPCHSRVHRS